jgi:hypothetical protein
MALNTEMQKYPRPLESLDDGLTKIRPHETDVATTITMHRLHADQNVAGQTTMTQDIIPITFAGPHHGVSVHEGITTITTTTIVHAAETMGGIARVVNGRCALGRKTTIPTTARTGHLDGVTPVAALEMTGTMTEEETMTGCGRARNTVG